MNRRIHILGCGNFGRRALEYYAGQPEGYEIILVDSDENNLEQALNHFSQKAVACQVIRCDAEVYLAARLEERPEPGRDWIIPTVPFHLAAAAASRVLERPILPWPELPDLPNLFFVGERHEVCSSLADFLCPADCPQPRTHCYHTGQPRDPSLLRLLARLDYRLDGRKLLSLLLASSQVAPGLGGFPLHRLYRLLGYIREHHPEALLLSTACRCHGVTSILGPAGA